MKSQSFYNTQTAGDFGDANNAHLYVDLAATPQGTVVDLGVFGAGTRVDDVKVINGALGAGTGIKVGYRNFDGSDTADDDAFVTVADTATAKTNRSNAAPIQFDQKVVVTLTVTGAAATGRVDVVVSNVYSGPG